MTSLLVNEDQVKLSNLDKIFWPEQNLTKGDLINYYIEIYTYIKDFLENRPLSLKIYPDGITGKFFFQKNVPEHAPDWLSTVHIYSHHNQEPINWIVVNKLSDLIWVVNSASIELHSWFSTSDNLDNPSFAVFDLDPGDNTPFSSLVETALLIKKILDELSLKSFLKTSGKTGLHIYIPIIKKYNYDQVKAFLRAVAEMVIKIIPELATIEWRINKRKNRVYIDYRQNGRGKTLPVPYSVRPTIHASVSAPLLWDELLQGIKPTDFIIKNIFTRLEDKGDIWADILKIKQELPHFLIT